MWKCFSKQCCGIVMNYCGSSSDLGKGLVPIRVQVPLPLPALFLIVWLFYILCWIRIQSDSGTRISMHSDSGSANAGSYGSWSSCSTTLAWRARFITCVTVMVLYLIFTVGTLANVLCFLSLSSWLSCYYFTVSRLIPPFPCWEQTRNPMWPTQILEVGTVFGFIKRELYPFSVVFTKEIPVPVFTKYQ
jgi:hypothetical protein